MAHFYGLTGSPALGETARDVAKGLPIRLLHAAAAMRRGSRRTG